MILSVSLTRQFFTPERDDNIREKNMRGDLQLAFLFSVDDICAGVIE